jgi:hypothetical protein
MVRLPTCQTSEPLHLTWLGPMASIHILSSLHRPWCSNCARISEQRNCCLLLGQAKLIPAPPICRYWPSSEPVSCALEDLPDRRKSRQSKEFEAGLHSEDVVKHKSGSEWLMQHSSLKFRYICLQDCPMNPTYRRALHTGVRIIRLVFWLRTERKCLSQNARGVISEVWLQRGSGLCICSESFSSAEG